MVAKIKIYMEGGGDGKDNKAMLRIGMTKFLEKATASSGRFQVTCCGPRHEALNKFRNALQTNDDVNYIFLLVDSEALVGKSPKEHLKKRDPSWQMDDIDESQIHLMAQVMESWLIADIDALEKYYERNFNRNAIPKNNNVEEINKLEIYKYLEAATKYTTKGKYQKIVHAKAILEFVDPTIVRGKAYHCDRFLLSISKLI
jgi:hypothetical protein